VRIERRYIERETLDSFCTENNLTILIQERAFDLRGLFLKRYRRFKAVFASVRESVVGYGFTEAQVLRDLAGAASGRRLTVGLAEVRVSAPRLSHED
jgi:hypothetical protein